MEGKGRIMKDELRSESQAEMGGAGLPAVLSVVATAAKEDAAMVGKSGKAHFSAQLIFLPSFPWAANRASQSKSVKVNQSDSVAQAGGPKRM